MDYSNSNNYPNIVIIYIEEQNNKVVTLEQELGVDVDSFQTLCDLVEAVADLDASSLNVDYYCLSILQEADEKHILQKHKLNYILNFIKYRANLLKELFQSHQMYYKNKLMYTYIGSSHNKMFLKRKDLFYKELQNELQQQQLISAAYSRIFEY
jgi:hypothetical protein